MYMNIDQIPAGKSLYTAQLIQRHEDGTYEQTDEIDFVAKRGLSGFAAQTAAYDSAEFKDGYVSEAQGGDCVVLAVADQIDGDVVFQSQGVYLQSK